MSDTTLDEILKLAAKHFNKKVETLSGETHLIDDLKGDSLDAVELVMNIEDHFDIEVPEDEIAGVRTLGGISTIVARVVAASKD